VAGPAHPGVRPPAARLLRFDRRFGVRRIAGADEAGRGCIAGPLVAAAVCIDLERLGRAGARALRDLDDSKRLSASQRERLAGEVMRRAQRVALVAVCPGRIDRAGLHRCNLDALARALGGVCDDADLALVDGFALGEGAPPHRAIVGGDRTSFAVAAAAVVAKTARDRLMRGPVAAAHPGYGFEDHVGYATRAHRAAVAGRGPTRLHRRSFRSAAYGPGVGTAEPAPGPAVTTPGHADGGRRATAPAVG
jgi:ribonuclease HII